MRKWLLAVSIIVVFYHDNVLVTSLPLRGLRPDLTLAFVVSLGVLTGSVPAAAIGFGMGLAADIFFNKIVGLTALTYMLSGAAAGLFYRKFYADNLIIPAAACVVCSFIKEHVFMFAALLKGSRPPYFKTLISFIVPCLVLTGAFCILMHLYCKHALFKPLWRKEAIKLEEQV